MKKEEVKPTDEGKKVTPKPEKKKPAKESPKKEEKVVKESPKKEEKPPVKEVPKEKKDDDNARVKKVKAPAPPYLTGVSKLKWEAGDF